ncbi:FtsB family cell division protein [Fibrobacter sp.]|uniref:FtsB family cell division protein n=1 Tax=Fibrobacter sp. TaxID=35828 RepID=UPI003890E5D9
MSKGLLLFILVILIAAAVVIMPIFFGKDSLNQQHKVSLDIEKYQAQIESLHHAIDSCNLEIERLRNDSLYKENLLRTRYGMSRKGEHVFQMVK